MISSLTKFTLAYLSSLSCITPLFALPGAIAPVADAQAKEVAKLLNGTILFTNGNTISGGLSHFKKESITITSPDLLEPANFTTDKISSITINGNDTHPVDLNPKQKEVTLTFNSRDGKQDNHEVIKGKLASIDEKHITLTTNYGGEIKILKKFISKIKVEPKYIYRGPLSLDEWHNNRITQPWKYANYSLISPKLAGNIAQNLGMPDEAHISFDLSWKNNAKFTLCLFSPDHKQERPDNCYRLNVDNGSSSLYKYVDKQAKRTTDNSPDAKLRMMQRLKLLTAQRDSGIIKKYAHYDIYMSKSKGSFQIYYDGVKLGEFADSHPSPDELGTALHIMNDSKHPVRIKNIRLSKWNGSIKTAKDAEKNAKFKGKIQRCILNNGDMLFGKANKMNNDSILIETLHAPFNIPLARIRSIDLTNLETEEKLTTDENDIKCWFKDEGWIILKPISIEGNTLTAFHPAIGENKFDLNRFKQVDFNIYDKNATPSLLDPDSW